jgi:hypothetical protein
MASCDHRQQADHNSRQRAGHSRHCIEHIRRAPLAGPVVDLLADSEPRSQGESAEPQRLADGERAESADEAEG